MSLTLIISGIIIFLLIFVFIAYAVETNKETKQLNESNRQLLNEKYELQYLVSINNAKLKDLEIETLKYSMQPHALRNLFAQMQMFSRRIDKGWNSLSYSMEYIFYEGKEHYVSISKEIEFVKSYLDLNGIFIHEINAIQLDLDGVNFDDCDFDDIKIPHLITAYFLENAFKHGDINDPEFLKVFIRADKQEFEMKVINKIRPHISANAKHGIGLLNMKKRLDLLMPFRYKIENSCNETEYLSIIKLSL